MISKNLNKNQFDLRVHLINQFNGIRKIPLDQHPTNPNSYMAILLQNHVQSPILKYVYVAFQQW